MSQTNHITLIELFYYFIEKHEHDDDDGDDVAQRQNISDIDFLLLTFHQSFA